MSWNVKMQTASQLVGSHHRWSVVGHIYFILLHLSNTVNFYKDTVILTLTIIKLRLGVKADI